ncbi:response regulator [Magnetospira sp. QH-2]|uniref:response regulator n=1 Tax=Magnetospira sp. (strain QH-2) TaxID=1288970 RepID=UPI0003E80B19|nr:response regulator [Magnetospira sp. QH-2]CCQ75211.1 putative CheY-like response regulator receiver protein [Magnetospira sp. QH-2]
MAVYDLETVSVFLVEDNDFMRFTMEDLLRQLGFRNIVAAKNGEAAIEYFKTMRVGHQAVGGTNVDIVITDLVMTPINGLLLLRWLRSAKESPNRFMPVLMISGAADRKYVESCRDMGVTEFLAKPYSVGSVYKKILEVIDYPRPFVMTNTYFGPDRRRQRYGSAPGGDERRATEESDITMVYGAKDMRQPKKEDSGVWMFKLPNSLKDKAGGMGDSGPGEFPADLLDKAEEKLERAKLDFSTWALDYLTQLSDLCAEALGQKGGRTAHFEKINLLALELRGQGGTFGYPLVTIVAKGLFNTTGAGCNEDDKAVEIVKAHIDTMRAVIREKISGDGGDVGRQLLKGLKAAIDKNS